MNRSAHQSFGEFSCTRCEFPRSGPDIRDRSMRIVDISDASSSSSSLWNASTGHQRVKYRGSVASADGKTNNDLNICSPFATCPAVIRYMWRPKAARKAVPKIEQSVSGSPILNITGREEKRSRSITVDVSVIGWEFTKAGPRM